MGDITEKQLEYFPYECRKATNYGKLYILPKLKKRLRNVPRRPVILNCGTPPEKRSRFLEYHLKPLMQGGWSYIKDSGDFVKKDTEFGLNSRELYISYGEGSGFLN